MATCGFARGYLRQRRFSVAALSHDLEPGSAWMISSQAMPEDRVVVHEEHFYLCRSYGMNHGFHGLHGLTDMKMAGEGSGGLETNSLAAAPLYLD